MTQGYRVKEIRKSLGLTSEKFGERLGVGKTAISGIETGRRNLTEQMIKSICREFCVNEIWLRTGEGGDDNMFTRISDSDRYSISLGKLTTSDNKFVQNALITLAETEPEKLKVIEEFMKKCLGLD